MTSYFDIAIDLSARLGADDLEQVVRRPSPDPGVRICVREPATTGSIRFRYGMATLTEGGSIVDAPQDEAERRGVWPRTVDAAFHVMPLLHSMWLRGRLDSAELSEQRFALDATSNEFRAVADPCDIDSGEHYLGAAPQVFVLLRGAPEEISGLLDRLKTMSDEREPIDLD